MHNDVGLLADRQRADSIRHADCLGAGDRGHLERLVGPEALWLEAGVAGYPRGQRRGAKDVGDIAGVARRRNPVRPGRRAPRSRHGDRRE